MRRSFLLQVLSLGAGLALTVATTSAAEVTIRGRISGVCAAGDQAETVDRDTGPMCLKAGGLLDFTTVADEVGCHERPSTCNDACTLVQTEVRGIGGGGVEIQEQYLEASASAVAVGSTEGCCIPVLECPHHIEWECLPRLVPSGVGGSEASLDGELIELHGGPGSHSLDLYINGAAERRGDASGTADVAGTLGTIIFAASITATSGGVVMRVDWWMDNQHYFYQGRPREVRIESRADLERGESLRFHYFASARAEATSNDLACSDAHASASMSLLASYGGLVVDNDCP